MKVRKLATTATVITALTAANLATVSTSALAHDRGYGARWGHKHVDTPRWKRNTHRWRKGKHVYRANPAWKRYRARHAYKRRHDNRAVALGITGLILGAIIATAANEHRYRH